MRDVLGPGTMLGYCTNVHAGATLEATMANLERTTLAVKAQVSPSEQMGVGLWLAAPAARELAEGTGVERLRGFLDEHGLIPFTVNGFPYGNFHAPVVKRDVYHPNWTTPDRLAYTTDLIRILGKLLPAGSEGSISTLPIGWRAEVDDAAARAAAAEQLLRAVEIMRDVHESDGVLVHLDLEPEPGCLLDTSRDVVRFFEEDLLRGGGREVLVHLRVCHDVCHAAVMFEDQASALRRYDEAGISVGKVQISSAVRARFGGGAVDGTVARAQLEALQEDRYQHQTTIRGPGGGPIEFHEDLPAALDATEAQEAPTGEWRVHFHVPIDVPRFGALETTQETIVQCLEVARRRPEIRHFEVETYAWDVLPPELKTGSLASGIASELTWVADRCRVSA